MDQSQSCKKHKYVYYQKVDNAPETARKRTIDIEISGVLGKPKPPSVEKPLLNQIFCFSVIFFLILLTGYVYVVHRLVYYEILESEQILSKMDYIVKTNEELVYKLQVFQRDLARMKHIAGQHEVPLVGSTTLVLPRSKRSVATDPEGADCRENKKRTRNKRPKTMETVAVQFRGSNRDGYDNRPMEGLLGPWFEAPENGHNMESMGLRLREYDRQVEISKKGLYYIYSQVTYYSLGTLNSYSINVISDKNNSTRSVRQISVCNTMGHPQYEANVSCYTSTVQLLNPGDVVYLHQIERNRRISFNEDLTYFGLILLNTPISM